MSRPISAAYLERKLRAITGIRGDNPLPDLADLHGLLVVEGDRFEWGRAGGESFWATGITAASVVGERSFVTIENPDGTGTVVVIEEVRSEVNSVGGAGNPFQVFTQKGNPLNAVPNQVQVTQAFCRDLRQGVEASAAIIRQGHGTLAAILASNVMTATGIQLAGINTGLEDTLRFLYLLPPLSRLWFVGLIDANQLQVGIVHRERPLDGTLTIK